MKKIHTDEEIIQAASLKEKNEESIADGKIDIVVDLDDEGGKAHTYVVTFSNQSGNWSAVQITELSAW